MFSMNRNIASLLPRVLLATGLLAASVVQATPTLPALNVPASGVELPGKFTWFDMATPKPVEQQDFYASLFGWSFRSPGQSDDDYALIVNRGRAIGGMFRHEPPGGEQDGALWIALMSVTSVDEAIATTQSSGGAVQVQAATVPDRGRHALLTDPAGAIFGVLDSSTGDPPDYQVEMGDVIWVDLFARDVPGMIRFYSGLAPYEISTRPIVQDVERNILSAHGMPRAGIVPVDEEANRAAWVPYVRVENVAATLEKVVEGGGFAIVAPDERILNGNVAVFVDPFGGVTGIVKWEYSEDAGQ